MTKNPFKKLLHSGEGKKLRALEALVPDIGEFEPEMQALTDTELQAKTPEFRQRLDNGEELNDLLMEAFAVVREAAWRVIGQRHYDVQLVGGAALHFGWVAEMKTGEGKTLTSTLPIYLNALGGDGVHVVTVNDYLATRDAKWMGEIYEWMGLDVGLVIPGNRDSAFKREQYDADITYGTNNELGFDYLRDNMAMSKDRKVQRGHIYCIVDEIDSILIDEARTPLIISGRLADAAKIYYQFASIVRGLRRDEHYDVDEEKRTVAPTEEGIHAIEKSLGIENLYDSVSANLVHQFQVALKAKELFHRDKDYLVTKGEVKIVDEFTGRILDGRRWSDGLHQAVEAKEGVKIKEENQTLATITLQNYFRLYEKLAGMTGTAQTEASEFYGTYGLHVVPIPTNKPLIRDDLVDLIYRSEESKFEAVIDDIAERHAKGQPILAGTISVEKSEVLSTLLTSSGIEHTVLNAKLHTSEAHVVAQAGRLGAVTVATNMAGRGVDIILGGSAEGLAARDVAAENIEDPEEAAARVEELVAKYEPDCSAESTKVKELGGLYVVATERHDSRRIDNQLRGRSGRQGDPGASRFYLSLEDELMRLFATGAMDWVMQKALPDDVAIDSKMVTKAIERAQSTVEQRNAEIRKNVLKYDEVMNEQRRVIYRRREQILDGADLREEALEYLAEAVDSTIATHCVSDYEEEWDLEGMANDTNALWPNEISADDVSGFTTTDDIYKFVMRAGVAYYEEREEEIGSDVMRQIERQVMLRIIDQRWREHLYEMDYLKEGIHLRAMGQKDPLTEWQREGYEMFGTLMSSIAQDFVRYVTHIQVNTETDGSESTTGGAVAETTDVKLSGPEDQGGGATGMADAAKAGQGAASVTAKAVADAPKTIEENKQASRTPVVKTELEKTPRNASCPCGSGKKFKHCHGR